MLYSFLAHKVTLLPDGASMCIRYTDSQDKVLAEKTFNSPTTEIPRKQRAPGQTAGARALCAQLAEELSRAEEVNVPAAA